MKRRMLKKVLSGAVALAMFGSTFAISALAVNNIVYSTDKHSGGNYDGYSEVLFDITQTVNKINVTVVSEVSNIGLKEYVTCNGNQKPDYTSGLNMNGTDVYLNSYGDNINLYQGTITNSLTWNNGVSGIKVGFTESSKDKLEFEVTKSNYNEDEKSANIEISVTPNYPKYNGKVEFTYADEEGFGTANSDSSVKTLDVTDFGVFTKEFTNGIGHLESNAAIGTAKASTDVQINSNVVNTNPTGVESVNYIGTVENNAYITANAGTADLYVVGKDNKIGYRDNAFYLNDYKFATGSNVRGMALTTDKEHGGFEIDFDKALEGVAKYATTLASNINATAKYDNNVWDSSFEVSSNGQNDNYVSYDINFSDLTSGNDLNLSKLVPNTDKTYIINVKGLNNISDLNIARSIQGDWANVAKASKLIWNFGDFSGKINTTKSFAGMVLAPNAEFSIGAANMNGSVIAEKVGNPGGEMHFVIFNGKIPDVTTTTTTTTSTTTTTTTTTSTTTTTTTTTSTTTTTTTTTKPTTTTTTTTTTKPTTTTTTTTTKPTTTTTTTTPTNTTTSTTTTTPTTTTTAPTTTTTTVATTAVTTVETTTTLRRRVLNYEVTTDTEKTPGIGSETEKRTLNYESENVDTGSDNGNGYLPIFVAGLIVTLGGYGLISRRKKLSDKK